MNNPFTNLINSIDKHQAESEKLTPLDNFSAHFKGLNQLLTLPDHKNVHFQKTAMRFALVLQRFMFVSLVCRRKIDAINLLIRTSVNSKNSIALAQGVRSLLEHVAVESKINAEIKKFERDIKGQTDGAKIHEVMEKAELFLQRCYFGRGKKLEANSKEHQALHINDCLKALAVNVPSILDDYDFLCEFVHPNHGSNSLVSSIDLNEQLLSIISDLEKPEIKRMADIASSILQHYNKIELETSANIGYLGDYTNKFLLKNAKLTNVFAECKVKPTGDGKSKESAFYFSNARTQVEALQFCSSYLQSCEIKLTGKRQNGGIAGEYIYDVYPTTDGEVWFKINLKDSFETM